MTPSPTCFADNVRPDLFDREPFLFKHKLLGHPALEMANLVRMIPTLPDWQVHSSSGKLKRSDDFERADKDHATGMTIEETLDSMKTTNSYVMVREPDRDGSFHPLYKSLLADVHGVLKACGMANQANEPKMYLFLSSPDSVTPFHIDRYTNFLMQFQGSKRISVFPKWDERVMTAAARESLVAYSGQRPVWTPEIEPFGTAYDFQPGDALHIPFVAGHHVRNGPDEVSISLSLFFKTDENLRLTDAMVFNDMLRRRGIDLRGVGQSPVRDHLKAGAWRAARLAARHATKIGAIGALGAAGAGAFAMMVD